MKVRDVMTTDPIRVAPDTRLREAARLMVRPRVSGLPVLGGAEPQPVTAETVAEVMTRSVVTITPEATVGEAARVMGRRNIKSLPVVDLDGELVGIISRADVVGAFAKPDA